jgi:hypothetical protein
MHGPNSEPEHSLRIKTLSIMTQQNMIKITILSAVIMLSIVMLSVVAPYHYIAQAREPLLKGKDQYG